MFYHELSLTVSVGYEYHYISTSKVVIICWIKFILFSEIVWHEMKEFLRNYNKPNNKDQLVSGILQFWSSVTVEKCW